MTDPRHQLIKDLFEGARSRPEIDRRSYLEERCAEDQALRREVLTLLELHDESPDFLREPALGSDFCLPDADALDTQPEPADAVPRRIGRYEIVRVLGEGGMGTVYEALQESPQRTVALKVIRPGVASHAVLHRFRHETQMLARLQHPGIAQIFEAGTFGRGRATQPYFAMEYVVNGREISEYCDARRLGTRDRLALLARVCDAVHHAHQQGVVHRDLKPGNILVDESGQPKILDFGVARATDSDIRTTTMRTDVGQILGTVPYMSPEQIAGDPRALDTRSDVYALGVLCFELLTGRLPLDVRHKSIPEAARIIQDMSPTRLTSIDRSLRGDVETIVEKALAKDKQRRYQSAYGMATDIRRFLADEPIMARPASTFYQLGKFTKRNKALVAGVTLAFVALLAAAVVSAVSWGRAERRGTELVAALHDTELEADKVAAINEFLVGMLRSVDPGQRGRDVSVREVLDQAAGTIGESFAGKPLIEAELRQTIASSYAGLGLYDAALDHARRALEIHTRVLGEEDVATLTSMSLVASQLDRLGEYDEAERLFIRTLELSRQLRGEEHRRTLAAQSNLALLHYRKGRRADAETLWRETLAACERVLGEADPITVNAMSKLAWLDHEQGRYDEAEALLARVLAARRESLGPDHPATLETMSSLGRLHLDQGRYDDAEAMMTEVLDVQRRVLGEQHLETLRCMDNIGWLYTRLARYDEAQAILEQELDIRRRVFGDEHPGTLYTMNTLSVCYNEQGRTDEAEALKVEALEIRRRVLGEEHPDTLVSASNLAALYYVQGRYDEVEPLWAGTLEVRRRILGAEHPDTMVSMTNLALLHAAQERYDEAESLYGESLALRRRLSGAGHPATLHTMSSLGQLYRDIGRYDESLALLEETVDGARRNLPDGHPFLGEALSHRGATLLELGRYEDAETDLVEAHTIFETIHGAEHRQTMWTRRVLVELYERWERPDRAAAWRERLCLTGQGVG